MEKFHEKKHVLKQCNSKTFSTQNIQISLTIPFTPTFTKSLSDDTMLIFSSFFPLQPLPPPLYIITPTYRRAEQIAEITRLGNTLKHIPNLFWLVIEDATHPTALVTKQLKRLGIPFAHLVGKWHLIHV